MNDDAPSSPDHEPFELAVQRPGGRRSDVVPAGSFAIPSFAGPSDAALFESFVAESYFAPFSELAAGALLASDHARVAHLLSRTGFLDARVAARLPGARISGAEPSPDAVRLANVKAAASCDFLAEHVVAPALPTPLAEGVFSHSVCVHPPGGHAFRAALLGELMRVLRPDGQVVLVMPVRGSFRELYDLMREYALKNEIAPLEQAIQLAIEERPTAETLSRELEAEGFVDVDVELHRAAMAFGPPDRVLEDPAMRLVVLPDVMATFIDTGPETLDYVRGAIAKYWSDATFALSVNVACAVGRNP